MTRPLHPDGAASLPPHGARSRWRGGFAIPDGLEARLRALDLPPEVAVLGWELARLDERAEPAARRALLYLAVATQAQLRQGSTRLPLGAGLDGALARLGAPPAERAEAHALAGRLQRPGAPTASAVTSGAPDLPAAIGRPGDFKPLLVEETASGVYLIPQVVHAREARLSAALRERRQARGREDPTPAVVKRAMAEARSGAGTTLSDEQVDAAAHALSGLLCVISGGPGTGKTSIVVAILRALVRLGVSPASIALAAPTGKAAHRLEESIRQGLSALAAPGDADRALSAGLAKTRTLHRLLGYSPARDRFRRDADNPLAEDVVIVDEASMIDLHLMDRLVAAVRPSARLVLLGDADQLPSVEAGAVLRDLCPGPDAAADDPRRLASVRLTRSYRMDPADPDGRHVLTLARAINEGNAAALHEGEERIRERATPAALTDHGVEALYTDPPDEEPALAEFLSRWWARTQSGIADDDAGNGFSAERAAGGALRLRGDGEERARGILARLERRRLLCLTRGGPRSGAEAVNAALHRLRGEAPDAVGARGGSPFHPGEPVILQSNDYEHSLWNGDQGVVLRVAVFGRSRSMVIFPRSSGLGLFPLDALRGELTLGYAMTVHKAQGSEFEQVGLILPSGRAALDLPLLTRELLYTAVSRARRSVIVVGRREVLLAGVARRIERSSGLGEKLAR